jgi:hypothetical protein
MTLGRSMLPVINAPPVVTASATPTNGQVPIESELRGECDRQRQREQVRVGF